ncbi:MAG: NAD(P)H-quinone dehydrogenase [Frankiales bacterium]|nr:NAD(P)H-quinone dehydrogenase [Frankiales bacterium]
MADSRRQRRLRDNGAVAHVTIVGGGPGGYEAALVAARLGAEVTLIERDGIGGATVLTDCVPSKTLIATSDLLTDVSTAAELGVQVPASIRADLAAVDARVLDLAIAQSEDIAHRLGASGVTTIAGTARIEREGVVIATTDAGEQRIETDAILVAVGAHPRVSPDAQPDGERILTWKQVYALQELPDHMIVVGSGVTGAEFASAYNGLGASVTLVSSRDRVLPGEDVDAANVIEDVFTRRGMNVMGNSRMASVARTASGVVVTLTDGRIVEGSHCLLALGSIPNTADLGLEDLGVVTDDGGFIKVDRVSRTSVRGIYAAGDCTGVLMLASVAAQQGRIAMSHLLGDAVHPLDLGKVSSNVFTSPEIATVGMSQKQVEETDLQIDVAMLPLASNARAKMQGVHDGFVKIFSRRGMGVVVGGVVVGPKASELIHALSLAVSASLTVDQVADAFTVYPSLSGSVAEAARRLHSTD